MNRIESTKNQKIKELKKLYSKKGREKSGTYIIESFHLVEEALKHKVEIDEILIREGEDYHSQLDTKDIPLTEVTSDVMKVLSDTDTPQGIVAICRIKNKGNHITTKAGRFLLIDRVQDPGNLGTMIRTADSAGIDAVILGEGTADLYNSKVIRSTQGSLFHLPIINGNLKEWTKDLMDNGISVYGTALENSVTFSEVERRESFALIMGNEGNGVSKELLSMTTNNLYVPIYGQAESLNVAVATGILLYHLRG